jgi:aromatic ring-opening dioxygenase LigB subunit
VEEARKHNVPAARIRHDSSWIPLTLDFGSTTPLWFMGAMFVPEPRVVIACAGPGSERANYPLFGRALRLAAEASGRRVAFIASADMGHAHDASSEFGYDTASAEFDQMVIEAVRNNSLAHFLTLDREWLSRAKPDAFGQLLMLHGMLADTDFQGEVMSYEVPTYFGMLCAAYERPSA